MVKKFLWILTATLFIGSFFSKTTLAAPSVPDRYRFSGKTAPDGQPPAASPAAKTASPSTAFQKNALTPQADTQPECPSSLMSRCHFVPAPYIQNNPDDKVDYGNYDIANRPTGGFVSKPGKPLAITGIVIHDTEGSLANTLAIFNDPTSYVSVHYIIDTDGQIYQMVRTKDVAWHAGNWYNNIHTIGIEHVGNAVSGGTDYTPAMYQSSALLVRYLAERFNFPIDHVHVLGHDNIQGPTQAYVPGMHYDPGPFWNWQLYLSMMGSPFQPVDKQSSLITITRPFVADDETPIEDCSSGSCVTLPKQPASIVYLHTEPRTDAPLLSDSSLHPDGSPGTTHIEDWSATASYGQQFVIAKRQGDWTGIWFGGKIGWFHNLGQIHYALPTKGQYITPKEGRDSIPVYGRAYPEPEAYTGTEVPVQSIRPLNYTIEAGQKYSTIGPVTADYYYAWAIDASLPDDHTVVVGNKTYFQIQYNHRIAYVDRDDVVLGQ